MADETTAPEVVDELLVSPEEDFKDIIAPPGWYDADIASCRAMLIPKDDKYNPGMTQVRVVYRLQHPDNTDLNGLSLSGFGSNQTMVVNPGKNFGWKKWLEAMGMPVEGDAYAIKPAEFMGLPVQVRLGTKQLKTKDGPRMVNTVEQVKKRDAAPA